MSNVNVISCVDYVFLGHVCPKDVFDVQERDEEEEEEEDSSSNKINALYSELENELYVKWIEEDSIAIDDDHTNRNALVSEFIDSVYKNNGRFLKAERYDKTSAERANQSPTGILQKKKCRDNHYIVYELDEIKDIIKHLGDRCRNRKYMKQRNVAKAQAQAKKKLKKKAAAAQQRNCNCNC